MALALKLRRGITGPLALGDLPDPADRNSP